tara:strand:+ start:29579 stop:30898 length:1320 start_codon:yes stop_codon:yes gene_type:complete
MKRFLWFLGPLLAVLAACNDDLNDSDFLAGDQFTDSKIRVVFTDTLSVETATMKFDSIITSQATRILVGSYVDSIFGKVRAASYFQLVPSGYAIDSEAEFDSIIMFLTPDNYYYNDTLQNNSLHIHRVTQILRPDDGDSFHNTSSATFDDNELGVLDYRPRPITADSIEVRLDDTFGRELHTMLQEKSITTQDQFNDYVKGLTIQPGAGDNGSVIGFSFESTASFVRLYFSIAGVDDRKQEYLDFTINTTASPIPFFNRITAEDPKDPLGTLEREEDHLSSALTGNRTFIQSGVGMATRIEFPHIKSIYDIPGKGTILGATLKIRPTVGMYDDKLMLRDILNVYLVDRDNGLVEQLTIGGSALQATLNRDNEEYSDIFYEITLGSYIEKLLLAEAITEEAIILLPDDYNSTVDRFVLNGEDNTDFRATLELTYAIYDED